MNFISFYYVCICVCYCVAAIEEHILINVPGEGLGTPEEITEKRAPTHDVIDTMPEIFDRTVLNKREGNGYTPAEQELILKAHNDFRGNVTPSAANMNGLTWSASLAKQAQDWSDRCVFDHPNIAQYPDYNGVGQNLFMLYGDITGQRRPNPVTQPTDVWYKEERYYDYYQRSCSIGKVCGHYTQVIWEATTEVGCGIKFCHTAMSSGKPYSGAWVITCNYTPNGNYAGAKPYVSGDTCSQCPGYCKDGLCSECDPSTPGCDCQIQCQNCATLDNQTCNCTCASGYYGNSCQNFCEDTHMYCSSNPGWPSRFCDIYAVVKKLCPAMCGVCTLGPRETNC